MVTKKKTAAKHKKPAADKTPTRVSTTVSSEFPASEVRISVTAQDFTFGDGMRLFAEDRPVTGADIATLKNATHYDLNTIESTLGISRREYFYELTDERADQPLPDIAMAILMRLYELDPKRLLPFQKLSWAAYLQIIGVHPSEFAQLVGRAYNAGRSWQEGGKPTRSIQLIIEAFWRAGVTDKSHPVFQEFLRIAKKEADLRGQPLNMKKAPTKARKRRPSNALVKAEESMMQPVDD
jgi:hypothetical protein